MKKRILSILLAAAMVVTLLPVVAFADGPKNHVSLDNSIEHGYIVIGNAEEWFYCGTESNVVVLTADGAEFEAGTELKVAAVSEYGYKLDKITVSYGSTSTDYTSFGTFAMPEEDVEISASFVENDTPVTLSEHTKMLIKLLTIYTGEDPDDAYEAVAYFLSDPANAGFAGCYEFFNGDFKISEDADRFGDTLFYISFLSVNAALNRLLSMTPETDAIDGLKCIISNAGPLSYKLLDLFEAYVDNDLPNYCILYNEVNEDRLLLCEMCLTEEGKTFGSNECFEAMRTFLTDDKVNGDALANPKSAYEAYAADICKLFGIADSAEIAAFKQCADNWCEDKANHFIYNNYSKLMSRDDFALLSTEEKCDYVRQVLVDTMLSCFDTILNNNFTGKYDYDTPADKMSDEIRYMLDHLMEIKENILVLFDVLNDNISDVIAGGEDAATAATEIYCADFGLYDFNLKLSGNFTELYSDWDKLFEACLGNPIPTGALEYTENDGVLTIKLLRDITCTGCACEEANGECWAEQHHGKEPIRIPAGKNVILNLNGFTLDRGLKNKDAAVEKGNVFTVNGKLTIQDNSTAQTGTITGGTSAYGAAIISNGETVLESGSITDCKTLSDDYDTTNSKLGRGGAIYVPALGKFTMTGGEIKNCSATVAGGAIFAWSGVVEITGGKISGCSVSGLDDGSGTVKAKGGAVYLLYAQMTMTGGEISGNTLSDVADKRGAGVYVATDAAITLGGTAKITGNTDGKGKASNLFLYDGTTFAISTEKAPANGMNVYVTTKTVPVEGTPVTISGTCSDVAKYFKADRSGEKVVFEDAVLKLAVNPNECEYEQKITKPVDGENYQLKLNGKEAGWFRFEAVSGGWKIMKTSEPGTLGMLRFPYLAMKDGKLTYTDSDNATVWTYKNGAFSTSIKTTQKIKTTGSFFGWIFGWGSKTITREVTTTYYLSTVIDGTKLSTCYVCAELYQDAVGDHDFGCWIDCNDGTHKHICKNCGKIEVQDHIYDDDTHECICGAYDKEYQYIKPSVTYDTKQTRHYYGWFDWLFGHGRNVTTYTATVSVDTAGVKVTKIEVAETENGTWIKSNTYTSCKEIDKFFVRITTDDGKVRLYLVNGQTFIPANR